jgi:hypothetical protein
MKFLGSKKKRYLLLLFLVGSSLKAQVVFLSGTPTPWQKRVTQKFLDKNFLNSPSLVTWDLENRDCKGVSGSVLHLCF